MANSKTKASITKVTAKQVPVYKQWWFWLIILLILGGIGSAMKKNEEVTDNTIEENSVQQEVTEKEPSATVRDYTGVDAKRAKSELGALRYEVKFVFDRPNQGGFTEESFQDYVKQSFEADSYSEMPFVVTRQIVRDKEVTLYIEYGSAIESKEAEEQRRANLEAKLSIVNAMTACEQYGKRNYRNFKMHSIVGRIAEYPEDDNTWFLKYYVDYDGYKNKAMECYVTGTSAAPVVSKFLVY